MSPRSIDLSADLGEGGADRDLLPYLSSAHLACGGHAGEPEELAVLLELLRARRIVVGVHPSYPDRTSFGREELDLPFEKVLDSIRLQLRGFLELARQASVEVRSVKPHGALYHRLARDGEAARLFLLAVGEELGRTRIVGAPGGALLVWARHSGFEAAAEGFIDRGYDRQGHLLSRGLPGALLATPEAAARQALALASGKRPDGELPSGFEPLRTLCVHSDTPGAAAMLKAARQALEAAGFEVKFL